MARGKTILCFAGVCVLATLRICWRNALVLLLLKVLCLNLVLGLSLMYIDFWECLF